MKVWINRLLLQTNIYVAISTTAYCLFFQLIKKEADYIMLGVVFTATLAVYCFARLQRHIISFPSLYSEQTNKLLFFVGILMCAVFSSFLTITQIIFLSFLAIFSLAYSVSLFHKSLRNLPLIKIFLISFVWSMTIAVLPFLDDIDKTNWQQPVSFFISTFLFVWSITIPFDIRDVNLDDKKLKTIPQLVGLKKAKQLALIAIFVSLIVFLGAFDFEINKFTVSYLIMVLASGFLCSNSHPRRGDFYFSFYLDGMPIFLLVLFVIFDLLF
jgi:hypothetical protein